MVGYSVLSDKAATVFSDEHIVLNTDASEVLIGLEFVKVEELFAVSACLPVVDEGRNEIDAGLVGHHESFFQSAAHAQAVSAKLFEVGSCLLVEAYVDLVEVLHIMHVKAHHVSQPVGQEHGVCSGFHGFLSVTLGQSQFLKAVEHQSADGKVNVGIFHTGLGHLEHVVVTGFYDGVNLQLPLRELTIDRIGAGIVGAVVLHVLATGIAEHETSTLQFGH